LFKSEQSGPMVDEGTTFTYYKEVKPAVFISHEPITSSVYLSGGRKMRRKTKKNNLKRRKSIRRR